MATTENQPDSDLTVEAVPNLLRETCQLEPTKILWISATKAFKLKYPDFEVQYPGDQHAAQFSKLVCDTVSFISAGWPNMQRDAVYASLQSNSILAGMEHRENICNDVIDFSLRVWLMVDCSRLVSSGVAWTWPECMDIKKFVEGEEGWFLKASANSQQDGQRGKRFPPDFTAVQLEDLSDIKVQWTTRLSDHLLLNEQENQISVFRYRAWLEKAHEGPECGLPIALLDETLRTLDLIFPSTDEPTQHWINKMGVPELRMARRTNTRWRAPSLRDFDFWRERLLDLVEKYQAPPRNPKGIWRDRRNPVSFWTFWIGLVIFFATLAFGLIASVLAGVTISDGRSNKQAEAIASLAAAISHMSGS